MSLQINSPAEEMLADEMGMELDTTFLCSFCEDIHIPAGSELDLQQELDVCRRCVRVEYALRFADFLLIN